MDRIRDSFDRQGLMRTLGARLTKVESGYTEIELPFSPSLTQQNGFFHAAATTAIADTAGGYAALTLMDETDDVLAVEFKLNLLRPAVGERLVARAQVLKSGKTLTVCRIDVFAYSRPAADAPETSTLVAAMTQTNMRMRQRTAVST
jgi:uncharacterized protein (TIGR00369 family)